MDSFRGVDDEKLDALLRAYRAACPTPEPSTNFMPELWQRIESRQRYTFSFRRMANALVTAAVALSIALGVYLAMPPTRTISAYSYVDALAEADAVDLPDAVVPVGLDLPDLAR